MSNIYEKLMNIQSELKAPKNQFNAFGKYNYRSCEDILEGLKPLLVKHKVALIINDDIILVGGRYYVKATAILTDTEEGGYIDSIAYAREDETKKGMDLAQVTGSTSSYARKYALNGLFAIDDTKDSDATNRHGKEEGQAPVKESKPPIKKGNKQDDDKKAINDNSLASDAQIGYIDKLIIKKGYTHESMIKYIDTSYNKKDLKALTKSEASEVINMLNKMGE